MHRAIEGRVSVTAHSLAAAGKPDPAIDSSVPHSARIRNYWLGGKDNYAADREAGVRQFLDIGTGLPTVDYTHEIAQRVAPESRIVYVDNDPLVLVHARALLTSTPPGATDYVDADVRDPDSILEAAARTLDFDRPVGLMLLGIMAHIGGDGEARAILDRLLGALPPGRHLVLSGGA